VKKNDGPRKHKLLFMARRSPNKWTLTDDLGDEGPHGDSVGKREDAEDDVVPPPDGLEGFRADLTDHKV
jgi:hypothetical protein